VPAGSVPRLLLWDTLDPYHYVRVANGTAGHDVLIVGGEDHKTGQDEDGEARYERLELWMRERFPMVRDIAFHWSGQVMEPNDGLAFIGRNPGDERIYIVTGESGNGMTYGTIAGIMLTDAIQGRPSPWAKLYDPGRIKLRAAGEFVKENLNAATQYVDLVTGGDVDGTGEIRPGSGAVVRRGIKKVAVYRDEQGGVHELSAICPHLGCVVRWNDGEKTWDCPCHGSRFAKDGHVINGPAIRDLVLIEPEESRMTKTAIHFMHPDKP
jgi:Rieske Fe-S protein